MMALAARHDQALSTTLPVTDWVATYLIDALQPPTRLLVSEWADCKRLLSNTASAEPGRWNTDRTPYLREIMDVCSAWLGGEVVFEKGAQIGGTEAINNIVGYSIEEDPAPMIHVMPNESMAKRNSKTRIQPMIDAVPELAAKVAPAGKGNTTLEKDFVGGVWVGVGANAPAGLRSMPAKRGLIDEEDGCPTDCGGEGDVVDLVRARLRTYSKSLLVRVSTPTLAHSSRIHAAFLLSDQRFYRVPCPHCNEKQRLVWDQLRWERGKPETVFYECVHCLEPIDERQKPLMLANGQWVSDNPDSTVIGFHLNSLYSPLGWYSWSEAVQHYERAVNNEPELKTFMNTVLGLPYAPKTDVPDWETLFNRDSTYRETEIPEAVGLLTAGIDVQADRIEMEVVGWGEGFRSWSIDYAVIPGDTASSEPWDALAALLMRNYYRRSDGRPFTIDKAAIDTGFRTQDAYRFSLRNPSLILPVKGMANSAKPVQTPTPVEITEAGRRLPSGVKLWPIGTGLLKMELYGWLRLTDPEQKGYCHFPSDRGEEWFKQLTAEEMVLKDTMDSTDAYYWRKIRDRNEALDCRIYARVAALVTGMDRITPSGWAASTTDGQKPSTPTRVGRMVASRNGLDTDRSRRFGGRDRRRHT